MDNMLERKQLKIFLLAAYGITYLMGIIMCFGYAAKADMSVFPSAQMMYPAAGVMLAYLFTKKDDEKMPRWFYRFFLLTTVIMIGCCFAAIAMPDKNVELLNGSISLWMLISQYVLIGGSILCWVGLIADRKVRRQAYGLSWKNWKASVFCILLFLILYFLRAALSYAVEGQIGEMVKIMKSSESWIYMSSLILNFFLVFAAFFGEEYGWRYYLQPLLQKKFGLRRGVFVLGIVWGIWHLPADFFYYTTPDKGMIMLVSQFITCISLGIFFAFAYMKTENIWVPTILHFLNNNLIVVITATYSADVLQNQQVTWGMIPSALLINMVVYGGFLLSKVFREKRDVIKL